MRIKTYNPNQIVSIALDDRGIIIITPYFTQLIEVEEKDREQGYEDLTKQWGSTLRHNILFKVIVDE